MKTIFIISDGTGRTAEQTLMAALAAYLGGWGLDNPSVGITGMLWVMCALTLVFGILWGLWLTFGIERNKREGKNLYGQA